MNISISYNVYRSSYHLTLVSIRNLICKIS